MRGEALRKTLLAVAVGGGVFDAGDIAEALVTTGHEELGEQAQVGTHHLMRLWELPKLDKNVF